MSDWQCIKCGESFDESEEAYEDNNGEPICLDCYTRCIDDVEYTKDVER